MSDIKKWMDIVVGAEVLASKLADIQSTAKSAISQEESAPTQSKGNEITINLTLDTNGVSQKVAATSSPIQSQGIDVPEVTIPQQINNPSEKPVVQSKTQFKENDTVYVSPAAGGGVGRFVSYTSSGAIIDIKGIFRELGLDNFSSLDQQYRDAFDKGNEWFHQTADKATPGAQNDKPEFRSGDIVKVEDVYGAVIGPGYGVFIAYSTSGQECIISFDNKKIVVPTANVSAVLEQESKNNFANMDNDGNLSPISFGSENRSLEENLQRINKEPGMDTRDEFSKWMSTVEEALSSEDKELAEDTIPQVNECGCGQWNCQSCFPDDNQAGMQVDLPVTPAVVIGDVDLPSSSTSRPQIIGGHDDTPMNTDLELGMNDIDADMMGLEEVGMGEEEETFVEKPKSGKGVKLGDIVKTTEFRKSGGQNSPMTYGDDNLGEDIPAGEDPDNYGKAGRYAQDHFGNLDEVDDGFSEDDKFEMISSIRYMNSMGLSKSDTTYDETQLSSMSPDQLRQYYNEVMGEVAEATNPAPKPTKTKSFDPDDLSDILNTSSGLPADLPATIGGTDDMDIPDENQPMSLPAASRDATQSRLRNMTPSDTMRDFMSRIDPTVGSEEPDLPEVPQNELVVRTARDVPVVISSAMQAAGVQTPEWHNVNDIPGYDNRNIRGMGRQIFGMFTSTPLEQIQTIANVNGQGPNTDAEIRAVAGWLRDSAEDMGDVNISHGMAIPGYTPDVKEYRANGIRFHVVRDPMGQYIYAYPDSTARISGNPAGEQNQLGGNMPRLSENKIVIKPTLFERLKWDEEIDAILKETFVEEEVIDESTLSKLLGKKAGGQNLVKWMHNRHRLDNDADLQPLKITNSEIHRPLWSEFKSNGNNFVIVSATNGVAAIKPYTKYIEDRKEEAAKKGKSYNPGGDSTIPYQIVAFSDDGQQIDPALLKPEDKKKDSGQRYGDPTVSKARMGKIAINDVQNSDNAFDMLTAQIGRIQTIWVTGVQDRPDDGDDIGSINRKGWRAGAVPHDKMAARAKLKGNDEPTKDDKFRDEQAVFNKIRPVLKTLVAQALSAINRSARRYVDGGNFEAAQKIMASGANLKSFLTAIDTSGDISLTTNNELANQFRKGLMAAAGVDNSYDTKYLKFVHDAASGGIDKLKAVLDGFRDTLINL